ncbi:ABC transporter permease [Singulisphaera acidiphila]|uniref:ABC-type antimicrobial peptide transport system, permease component n=1 Tax=Singulisphaera acidiphila (strain ATCC BAA-1392 / DSM 18658 / VKM B-2454 / MOB10) TaxID=886293 RepID=L0DB04_SINAD|nr:ABC transporter permease [Singulisphaera acidiphila]AGA25846.1 ABC-type antimicrobial peptide transport system, permease component [Singulisphaera acidiphila DSM 18658]
MNIAPRDARLFFRLAIQGLGHRPVRAALLALAVAVGGASVFTATVLCRAIQVSMGTSLDRLGADLMVVPKATTVNLTTALLTVEPTEATIDPATIAALTALPGVDVAAPQRYFGLPSADSSHGGHEDLIAFDPVRDFTVRPWLIDSLGRPLRRNDLIVGGRRPESLGSTVKLFNRDFTVYGRLALTGVGSFERAYFASFETVSEVAVAAQKFTGHEFATGLDTDRATALLVRLKVGATPEQFRFAAARRPEVQVVAGNGLSTSVRQALLLVLGGSVLFSSLILLTMALMVGALYTGLLNERRRELGLLLAVGMRPLQVVRLILAEAALTTGLGGISGVVLGAGGLVLFERSIGYQFQQYKIPFVLPGPAALIVMGGVSIVLCSAVGVAGAVFPAWCAGRAEPYALIRGEGT